MLDSTTLLGYERMLTVPGRYGVAEAQSRVAEWLAAGVQALVPALSLTVVSAALGGKLPRSAFYCITTRNCSPRDSPNHA